MRPRRAPVLLLVALLLAGGGVADRLARPRPSVSVSAANRALMPSAAPEDALSSSWFCVGASAGTGSAADGTVHIINPTDQPASGTVTVVPAGGQPATAPVEVAPMATATVPLRTVAEGPWAAAVVDLDSGQVAAELLVQGGSDSDASACSNRASDRWHFADGVTAKDASLALSLFNPFPEDAIVDLSFATDQGRAAPAAFRPVVVPGRSLVVREIGEHVRRREAIATEVVVRTGRVVAAQTQRRTAPGRAGLSISLGAPSAGTAWYFASGMLADGVNEHFAVSNPGASEATVLFEVILDEGVTGEIERSVPARGRVDVVLNEEAGVPRGVGHSTSVLSLDDEPVIVSRTLEFNSAPAQVGRADALGARRSASRWVFAAGGAAAGAEGWLVVVNLGDQPARLSLTAFADGRGAPVALTEQNVRPGRRVSIRLNDIVRRDWLPLLLESTEPVVVERAVYGTAGGVWVNPGIPLD